MEHAWETIKGGAAKARGLAKRAHEFILSAARRFAGESSAWRLQTFPDTPNWLLRLTAFAVVAVLWFWDSMASKIPGAVTRDKAAEPGLWLELGKNVAAAIGGVLAIWALHFAHRRLKATDEQNRIAEQGNITERFTRAGEMLGATREVKRLRPAPKGVKGSAKTVWQEITELDPNIEVRLVALHAMERLALDSAKDYPTIIKILCAYVRENAKKRKEGQKLLTDVQVALTILGSAVWKRAEAKREDRPPMDLGGADLRGANLIESHLEGAGLGGAHLEGAFLGPAHLEGADLRMAYLEGANLYEAHLERAYLGGAHLEGAILVGAHLEHADLSWAHLERAYLSWAHLERADLCMAHLEGANLGGAHLEGANLIGAHLEGAHLFEAHLEGAVLGGAHLEGADLDAAHLEGAKLEHAEGLTQDQINQAYGDERTELPKGLTRPARWKKLEVRSEKSEIIPGERKDESSGWKIGSDGRKIEPGERTGGPAASTGGVSKRTGESDDDTGQSDDPTGGPYESTDRPETPTDEPYKRKIGPSKPPKQPSKPNNTNIERPKRGRKR